jgi:hypothetical protein
MRPSFHPHHGRPAAEDLPDQNHCQPADAARPRAPRTPLRLGLSFAVHAASLRTLTPSAQQKRRGLQKPRPEVLPPSTLNRSHGTVLTAGSLHSPGSGAAAARDRATAGRDLATTGCPLGACGNPGFPRKSRLLPLLPPPLAGPPPETRRERLQPAERLPNYRPHPPPTHQRLCHFNRRLSTRRKRGWTRGKSRDTLAP